MSTTKTEFIKIQKIRYRTVSIKRYEPFETSTVALSNDKEKTATRTTSGKFGIYIYFAMTGDKSRVFHYYKSEDERDSDMEKLDQLFNLSY
jgi:hypothetical protein